jgi:hypothetical protein
VVHLGRLLAAGIEVPSIVDCNMTLHGQGGRSSLGRSDSRSERSALEARLRERVAGDHIVWLLAVEARALTAAEEWQRLSVRPRPWSDYQDLQVRYVPVEQITRADVVTIEDDPRAPPVGELLVEVGSPAAAALDSGWGVHSAEFDQWWLPDHLPEADRPDPTTGIGAYRFRLYAGHYSVRCTSSLSDWRESLAVQIQGGESKVVSLPEDAPDSTVVRVDVTDADGRAVQFFTLVFLRQPRGPAFHHSSRIATGEPTSRRFRIANGKYDVHCSATGLGHLEQIVELDGGEMELSFTLPAR